MKQTAAADAAIKQVNELARKVNKRKGLLDSPLAWDDNYKQYRGFFCDMDDGRLEFRYFMTDAGFKEVFYKARYHWAVANDVIEVEYIEGDLYAKILTAEIVKA